MLFSKIGLGSYKETIVRTRAFHEQIYLVFRDTHYTSNFFCNSYCIKEQNVHRVLEKVSIMRNWKWWEERNTFDTFFIDWQKSFAAQLIFHHIY